MARDLEIKITADGSQAKRELGSVDNAIKSTTTSVNTMDTATGKLQLSLAKFGSVIGFATGAGLAAALVGFGKAALDDADALTKLHDKTGISVEGLQRLRIVGDAAGNSLDTLTMAISMMQRRMSDGETSAINTIKRLNLNFDEIRKMKPDDQFIAIGNAISKMTDPADQVAASVAIFGRTGAEVLPTLKAGFQDLGDSIGIMSARSVEALDKLGDSFGRIFRGIKGVAGEVLGTIAARIYDDARSLEILFGKLPTVTGTSGGAMPKGLAVPGLPEDLKVITRELEDQHQALVRDQEAAERYAKTLADLYVKGVQASIVDAETSYQDLTFIVDNYRGEVQQMTEDARDYLHNHRDDIQEIVDVERNLVLVSHEYFQGIAETGQELESVIIPAFSKLPNVMAQNTKAIHDATKETDHFGQALTDIGTILSNIGGKFADVANIGVRTLQTVMERLAKGDLWGAIIAGVSGAIAIIGKLWGKIKELFGGPSAAELAGREVVDQFEQNLHKMLTAEEQLEAGNDSWKQTVIAVRDAYLKAGLTEAQALIDVKNLWDSSRQGPEAVAAAIKLITDRMNGLTAATNAAGDAIANLPAVNTAPTEGQTMHLGGTVLPFVARAHRGLALDEVPIIAQSGEGILNRGAMRRIGGSGALNRMNAGGGFGGVINQVTVYADGDLNSMAARQKLARTVKQVLDDQVRSTRKLSAR